MIVKRFESPDDVAIFERGRFEKIALGPMTLGRASYEPGWKWSQHLSNGERWCTTEHVGIVLSGAAAVEFEEGTVMEMRTGDAFHITGAHDSWVIGDEPYVSLHIAGVERYVP
jgi:quercetin dioxygenase-like cupin family protein